MFPLGMVLLPGGLLPLRVFEPRYLLMMQECFGGDGEFGVVLIERGREVGGGDVRFGVGCVARIVEARELPGPQWSILTVGDRRIRVERWLDDDPFPRAEVEDWPDAEPGPEAAALRDRVLPASRRVLAL